MGKSLGDYNIERSSSTDINNIKWTHKNPTDSDKSKSKKTTKNTSSSNIIYAQNTQKIKTKLEKIFKVKDTPNIKLKNKKKNPDKRFQTSSSSNCNIEPGFTRKAR